ncbi:MAG TPA: hypothetical protein VMW16_10870 [Sedimentisphaerales bacterium]|nr:hypothetical protein [Sedimentisphaerales bacterium]
MLLSPDQVQERRELLQQCLNMSIIQAQSYANSLSEEQFLEAINGTTRNMLGMNMRPPATFPENYFGQYYTIQNAKLRPGNVWDQIELDILQCLTAEREAREVLEYFLNQPAFQADFTVIKARFRRWRNTLDSLLGFKLIRKLPGTAKDVTTYALYAEMVPLLRRVLDSPRSHELPVINSEAAQAELAHVQQMEKEFEGYLRDLLANRLEETLEFGREHMSLGLVTHYLEELFGPMLYFDVLLALVHQYGMTATEIVNPEGTRAGNTGFHLALFGAPGTGKTFSVKDVMLGDEAKNVLAHGLPGLNRYCGGMTPANFIRIGEAYQGKRFNFVVTEFNDWFRYKGMVEPLKLALEQGRIRYETKVETIGPYEFSCFFSTNYNTQVSKDAGYRITVADPNFNAIEDRMLVRMHRMTKQRLRELSRNQRELAMGRMRMRLAGEIRDHLTLVYAIQTQHPLVKERFERKRVVLRDTFFHELEKAQELVLGQIRSDILFSVRVRQNAIKLAGALTLFSYFAGPYDRLEIGEDAMRLAIKFFVEEVAIRQKVSVDVESILYTLGLSDINRAIGAARHARRTCVVKSPADSAEYIDVFHGETSHELRMLESKYAPDTGWDAQLEDIIELFGTKWDGLDDEVRGFLSTGEVLLKELERLDDGNADYAPVVIEYAKALECHLHKEFFESFKESLRQDGLLSNETIYQCDFGPIPLSPSERRAFERSISELRTFLSEDKALTMGAMWHILLRVRHEVKPAPVLGMLLAHLRNHKKAASILEGEFIKQWGRFIESFRNGAAHSLSMTLEQAKESRDLVVGNAGSLLRLLV